MSWLNEINPDALSVTPDAAARGPRVGFLESFEVGYNAQVRASAMYGIEKAMYEQDLGQINAMRRAGIEDIPALSDDATRFLGRGAFSADYIDVARYYQDGSGNDPNVSQSLREYDAKIEELKKRYPDLALRNSRELWGNVREQAQMYEKRAATDRTSFMGTVGSLVGGMVGGLNVEADPLNFATLPIAGGLSVLRRMAIQGGGQGAAETINQLTGVQEERRLLGLDYGVRDAITRIGAAAIGGAAFQGAGEAVAAAVKGAGRRWFRPEPGTPAPPTPSAPIQRPPLATGRPDLGPTMPADEGAAATRLIERPGAATETVHDLSPTSLTRLGKQRTILDLDYVTARLDDWNGEFPYNLGPKTDTAIAPPRNDFTAKEPNIFERSVQNATIDDLARQIDPATFGYYDKYAKDNEAYRKWLAESEAVEAGPREARLGAIDDAVLDLQTKQENVGGMKRKTYQRQIDQLKAERQKIVEAGVTNDTLERKQIRRAIARNDEKMRDLAPVVSRAYARARKKWTNTEKEREAINRMIREGRTELRDTSFDSVVEALPRTIYDDAPILKQSAKYEAEMPKNYDAADMAGKIVSEQAKITDEALEATRTKIVELVGDSADTKPKKPTEDLSTDIATYTGPTVPAIKVGGKLFTGKRHSDALEKAIRHFGSDSEEIAAFEALDDPLSAMGLIVGKKDREAIKERRGTFRPGISGDDGKGIAGKIDELKAKIDSEPTNTEISIPGISEKLHLDEDTIVVPHAEGTGGKTMTIREFLREQRDAEEDLQAVNSCSLTR